MRKLYASLSKSLALLMILMVWASDTQATHFMGIDISYQCLSPCIYRITWKTYYDCTGGATPRPPNQPGNPTFTFTGTPAGCNSTPLPAGAWVRVQYIEVTPICPGFQTGCSNPTSAINGVREAFYYRDYDVCTGGSNPCTKFNIGWGSCCRNGVITSGAANGGIYTGNTVIDLTITPCNSSPTFLFAPVPYICAGQPFTFNQGAFDPDGDSLSYRLVNCIANAPTTSVGYAGGYSPAQPLGPDWNVRLNPFTGDITMTPNPNGGQVVGVMCIEIEEFRNGVKIGSVVRDMQITVITGCTSTNPTTGGVQNLKIGGVPASPVSRTEVLTCAGTQVCFDIPVISQDTALNYTISWNQQLANLGATFTDTAMTVSNTVPGKEPIGRFCWTPTQRGTYSFVVTARDDACPIPGLNQFTVLIYVDNVLQNSTATAVPIQNCNSVELTAFPRTRIQSPYNNIWYYDWSGNGNLQPQHNNNLQDSQLVHLYPAPNNYFYDLTLEDTFGCVHQFRNFFTLNSGVIADAGPDLTICSGFQFQLGSPPIPGQFYRWRPSRGLNDTTVSDPVFTLTNLNIGQVDTIDFSVYVTDSVCNTEDFVRVVVNPSLQVRINPANPLICRGDSITLTASGGSSYLWSTGDTTASIRVGPFQNTRYSVVTFDNGCTSQPQFVDVSIDPGPPGDISGTFRVCSGDAALLVASGATDYFWSNTAQNTATNIISNVTGDSTVYVIPSTNGCRGDTIFANLSTYPQPVPDFSPTTVCQGIPTEFQDLSTIPGGSIVGWSWNFGDGTISNLQDPTHTYGSAGTYNVTLRVTSDNGCESVLQQSVRVENVPQADFDFTNVCFGSPSAFTDNSNVNPPASIVNYAWKFGDGVQGDGNITTHEYDTSGYYNATLIITTAGGCVDSFTQTVFVHPNPVADFALTNACQDSVVFSFNGSAVGGGLDEIVSYAWDFGDPLSQGNNFSSLARPTHVYEQAGQKTVILTVTTGNGCVDTAIREVTIFEEPRVDFSVEGHCEGEIIYFQDATVISPTTPIVSWNWDMGNGVTSTSPAPNLIYRDGAGTYPVYLQVTSSEGCTKSMIRDVVIDPSPRALFLPKNACPYDSAQFIDQTQISSGSIVQWDWDFGGPGRGPSGVQNPSFLYDAPGSYQVIMTATSDKGCSRSAAQTVRIFDYAPTPELTEDTVCFSDPAYLIAGASSNIQVRWYESLNAAQRFHMGNTYVTEPLASNTTYYVTTMTPQGCVSDRFPITAYVTSDEDLSISPSRSLVELPVGTVEFTPVSSIELTGWSWSFGDGNVSDLEAPVHEYENPGRYEVILTGVDRNGCEITASTIIEVKKVVSAFMPSAFTPNGDGYNDVFKIGPYNLRDFQIRVFSRWGTVIYEANEPGFEWDGKDLNGQDVPEGVYVYVIRFLDINGKTTEQTGTITLIR
jgi:gliding motility-associated-like protein